MSKTKHAEPTTRAARVRAASLERRALRKTELRQTILDAAGELFLEQGYERFSMRQVAERIGYTATTLYRYFDNKDSLVFAVVDRGFEEFGASLVAAAESTDDPVERLRALGRAYVRFGLANPVYYQLMFMQRIDYLTKPHDGDHTRHAVSFQTLLSSVQTALDARAVPGDDALELSHALWAFVHGIVSLAIVLDDKEGFAAEPTYERGIGLFLGPPRTT